MKLERIHPGSSVSSAMMSATIKALSPVETIVYLRLVAMSHEHATVYPTNAEVHKDTAATKNAIKQLAELGLIRIRRGKKIRELSRVGREIEVLR